MFYFQNILFSKSVYTCISPLRPLNGQSPVFNYLLSLSKNILNIIILIGICLKSFVFNVLIKKLLHKNIFKITESDPNHV